LTRKMASGRTGFGKIYAESSQLLGNENGKSPLTRTDDKNVVLVLEVLEGEVVCSKTDGAIEPTPVLPTPK